ncbi:clathrin light chain A-like isoform X1 [Protopterus annectens]|uniref:clathrin light chain A-like isoform X1 n=1 Tax=Protopterus annectens TaxID=7888 RepID=UPI001CFB37B7|nr:clathrin light chain A-like isoform X1 [Protopterus annectens]
MDDFEMFNAPQNVTGNGVSPEEDPAAAFLAQQESEIAGIENDEGFSILDSGEPGLQSYGEDPGDPDANSKKQEVEWKEKAKKELDEWYSRQNEQLEKIKANNRVADEAFYKQPFADVIGYVTNITHPCYRLEQAAEEAFISDAEESLPGSEWERVARLCDFNPKSSKQAKDVSRMRSVLISLKQAPLVR